MGFNEDSLFPSECIHTLLFEGRTNSHKLLVQLEAVALQQSFLAVQALACLAEVGHCFVHRSRKQFQPVMCMEATTAFMERDKICAFQQE